MVDVFGGFWRHDALTQSAALAFFFLMSMFPFVIFIASALALLPIGHLVERSTELLGSFLPEQLMPLAVRALTATMRISKGLLSIGFVGAVVFASNGFAAMIAALDKTYEVQETRSFWRLRLLAIVMTLVVGSLIGFALIAMLLGPHFGLLLADAFDVSDLFVAVWPYVRWIVVLACAISSIELLYYWGPNRKHAFKKQMPGAVFALVLWALSSAILGIYLRSFTYFNSTYGALGAFILLMLRFQLSALAMLLGAELNAQLVRRDRAVEYLSARARAAADRRQAAKQGVEQSARA